MVETQMDDVLEEFRLIKVYGIRGVMVRMVQELEEAAMFGML